ncbi:MAG: hypothetical protein M9939_00895 [Mesorhizobium sp.]|nr:hypothetical protein [Mesorhizobium sp.]MCO5159665.1 hypothetical protein [Mesorhizobium sp.]
MTRDLLDEALNIALSQDQRAEIDKHMRWHLALLDAGISEAEATDIIADLTAPEMERIAA